MLTALQQTADNADQIKEIEERVQSLGEVLASPVGVRDDAEKARRNALRKLVISPSDKHWHFLSISLAIHRKLDRIMAKLRPLSEQSGILKFLKNANHTKTLNGFVQDLDTAVTDYQVCATNPHLRTV